MFLFSSLGLPLGAVSHLARFLRYATNGQSMHLEQVSVAKWKNGKIVHERFYYDTGKK